jgi:hypothetical protein
MTTGATVSNCLRNEWRIRYYESDRATSRRVAQFWVSGDQRATAEAMAGWLRLRNRGFIRRLNGASADVPGVFQPVRNLADLRGVETFVLFSCNSRVVRQVRRRG